MPAAPRDASRSAGARPGSRARQIALQYRVVEKDRQRASAALPSPEPPRLLDGMGTARSLPGALSERAELSTMHAVPRDASRNAGAGPAPPLAGSLCNTGSWRKAVSAEALSPAV